MLQTLIATVVPQLLTVVVPLILIPLAVRFLPKIVPSTSLIFDWVKNKAGTIENEFAKGVLSRLTSLVQATVISFENTRIEELKTLMADGQITKEELAVALASLKADAMAQVKTLIAGQGLWDRAMYVFGNQEGALSQWIDTTIEAAVSELPASGLQTSKDGVTPAAVMMAKAKAA